MINLALIKEYVKQTAIIIASVIDMDVLIIGKDFLTLADSSEINNSEGDYLNQESILTKVMEAKEPIILNSKDENYGCLKCKNYSECDVEAIVGVPILYEDNIIGSIGVYAPSKDKRLELIDKRSDFISFINRMCDLMVSRLLANQQNEKLNIMRKQLMTIMDSMEDAVVALDEEGKIIYNNKRFSKLVEEEIKENRSIFDFIEERYIGESIFNNKVLKNKEIYINSKEDKTFSLISTKAIEFKDKNIGIICTLKNMLDVYKEVNDLSTSHISTSFDDIIGENLGIKELKKTAKKLSNSKSTVLIYGESGTGKELFARAIHNHSDFRDKPFIAVNCSAIPENLLESEFFGYEEGAFSGAKKGGKLGKFQLAHGGTIFLDEIGEMPIHLQPKILRVLQEKSVEKLGARDTIPIDVRVIAATNQDLKHLIEQKKFREDLFYRLNVIPFEMIPLRDRKDDIPLLLDYFLSKYNRILEKDIKDYTSEVKALLLNHKWIGNVRELENTVEYMVNISNKEYLTLEDMPMTIKKNIDKKEQNNRKISKVDDVVKEMIEDAISIYGDTVKGKTMAAKALGISRATLYRKLKNE